MIELAFPWALLLLPAPWLVARFAPPWREQAPALRFPFFHRITSAAGVEPKAGSVIRARLRFQMAAAIIVWVLLVLALSWPERVGEPIELDKAARDLVLAVDISGSMDQRDFETADGTRIQRLQGVKDVVGRFIDEREGDRVSLIVFGSQAFMQAPFTEDLQTVRDLLDQTEVGMAGPHTVIGDAIGLAIRAFESSEIDQRLLVLLSDGQDTGSKMTPVNAAEIAASKGVQIFTIGVGDPDGEGENRVDPASLEDIATRAGGEFFFADDQEGLAAIYERIDELTPRDVETLTWSPRQPLAHWLLGLAALIALAATGWLEWQTGRRAVA